jgi:hypothetical protein
MEAATPLPFPPQVRTLGDHLRIDGLVVDDECAVRLAREREEAGEDVARLVRDAIEIGARVLDREQTGANADFVRAEFERAARELDTAFVERAAKVAERLDGRLTQVFDDGDGHLSKVLGRHFGEESAGAVQHQIRAMVGETLAKSREDLVRQFSAGDGSNPLADFKNMARAVMTQAAERQAQQLDAMTQRLEAMKLELVSLRADRELDEHVAAEAERGTAKGRSYEEEVAAAVDALALPLGDDCEAVGDHKEATSKKGDVVVSIGACHGAAQGRIVFEAKNSRLTRPRALEELDAAKRERNADYAVLVVPSEEKIPAKMHPLREYNGDKLIVAYDAEEGPLALQVAYALARARVLMARGGSEGVDGAAVADTVERAVGALEDVRRIRQQLTGAKTQIDKASEIVGAMSDRVRQHLEEIAALVDAGAEDAQAA